MKSWVLYCNRVRAVVSLVKEPVIVERARAVDGAAWTARSLVAAASVHWQRQIRVTTEEVTCFGPGKLLIETAPPLHATSQSSLGPAVPVLLPVRLCRSSVILPVSATFAPADPSTSADR